jgi:uncharacterized DUF497 family protein
MQTPYDFAIDSAKDAANVAKHSVSLARVEDFDFKTAVVAVDDRFDYGEKREVATGFLDGRMHVLVFTMRGGVCRAISLRKANKREIKAYVDKTEES